MRIAQIQLPTALEIVIRPGPDGTRGTATLRAFEWVAVPQSGLDLKITPAKGDVHYEKETGTYRIALTLAAQIQKPIPPPDPPLVILP